MISEDKVKHIAELAKLNIKEEEMEKYQKQLGDILTEIEKIVEVEIKEDEIMISPSNNKNNYSEDVYEQHITKEDIFKNAKNSKGDYLVVPKVLEGDK